MNKRIISVLLAIVMGMTLIPENLMVANATEIVEQDESVEEEPSIEDLGEDQDDVEEEEEISTDEGTESALEIKEDGILDTIRTFYGRHRIIVLQLCQKMEMLRD